MQLVVNASPLIFLAKLDALFLLDKDRIFVPLKVKTEVQIKDVPEKEKLSAFFKQKNVSIENIGVRQLTSKKLGPGEESVISLALAKEITDVILDDLRARSLAEVKELNPHGTIWVILRGLKTKQINKQTAKNLLYKLASCGLRLDERLWLQAIKAVENF